MSSAAKKPHITKMHELGLASDSIYGEKRYRGVSPSEFGKKVVREAGKANAPQLTKRKQKITSSTQKKSSDS